MPIVQADRLSHIGTALLKAAGASEEEAKAVAVGCVNANLAGHDSHGVIAIPTYIDRVKAGHIMPGAKWTIVQETPTTTVIDGHWGFGFHVNAKAMELTINKAKTANVAACTVFRQSHVGRLAHYPMMAMREGMIGIATADSGRSPKHVAPFGGREARLGTNPISIAVPSDLEAPFYLDMATSAVAAGKIQLAAARGKEIPTGWIVDSGGRQTTDPTQFRKGGALLPLGGTEGYKGSGLAAMVEVLRRRADRTSQRRLLHGGVQRRRVPSLEQVQERGRRVRALSQGDAAVRRFTRRVLSGRGRIHPGAATQDFGDRSRGRDMGKIARAGRRIQAGH